MWQRRILLCKIISFQNDNPFGGNHQEIIFFGVQKGLWVEGGVMLSYFFEKKGGNIFNK